jgi:imidazolonepropionase-like amidohydrolase
MIGGQAAVVKPVGLMIEDMILRRSAGLKIALRPTGNRSRMSQMAALRRSLNDVRDYISTELEERGDSDEAAQPDIRREAMVRLLRGEIPAFLYCERAMDVRHALELVNEFRLKGILVLDGECYKAVDRVAASGLPVVIGPQLAYWQTHPVTDEDEYITLPSIYAGAGIKPTFQVTGAGGGSLLGANFHWYQAATNVRHGAPAAEALESITIRPARQLGVDSLVGSIEVGKDADLVILSGEPLELGTWVEKVIVNGRIAYDRAEDAMIRDLLNPKTNSAVDGAEK